MTFQQYVDTYYDSTPAEKTVATQNLRNAGAQAIVHEKWIALSDEPTADVVVLRFASAQGARSRALAGEGGAFSATQSDGLRVAIPGLPGYVYPHRSVNADGFVNAEYYAAVGNLLMVVHFASTGSFDETDFGVSGPGSAEGGYTTTADSVGLYRSSVYGYVGDVVAQAQAGSQDSQGAISESGQAFSVAGYPDATSVPRPAEF